jgi:hypothetical protein
MSSSGKIGQVESVTCQEILDEFAEKLLVKFKFSEDMAQAAVDEVSRFSRLVEISGTLKDVHLYNPRRFLQLVLVFSHSSFGG